MCICVYTCMIMFLVWNEKYLIGNWMLKVFIRTSDLIVGGSFNLHNLCWLLFFFNLSFSSTLIHTITLIMFFLKFIGPWRAWCCQLTWAWRIYKSEKYSNYRTREIWNWNLVFFSISTRIQWLFEAVLLWVLP